MREIVEMTNILAIIPARGGSKRLPGKNIKELDGRPLIAYSVLAAKAVIAIKHICVATDDDDVFNFAWENNNIDLATHLPEHLTTDTSTLTDTLKYTLEFNQEHGIRAKGVDWIVLLQPTCPLRQPSLINRWIQQVLATPNCDGGLTVDRGGYKLGNCSSDGYFNPEYKPMTPKQNAHNKNKARENGVFYMFRAENVLKGQPWGKCMRMIPLECPPEQSLANVDEQLDWDIMEFLYYKKGYKELFGELDNG